MVDFTILSTRYLWRVIQLKVAMERDTKKRDRSDAELNNDEFDLSSPDRKMRLISESALIYKDPIPLTSSEIS